MRNRNRDNRILWLVWVQTFLVLMFGWCPFGGDEWRCPDGSLCRTCVHASCAEPQDCACLGEKSVNSHNCRSCCHYVTVDTLAVHHAATQYPADWQAIPARLPVVFVFLPPIVVQKPFAVAPSFMRGPPLLTRAAPRAPPSPV